MGMETFGAQEEFGLVQQQLCMHIAGVKDVQQVLPWREEVDGSVKYEQFVDGVTKRYINNVLKTVEEKTVIRKTVTENGVTTRWHTLDYWANRKTAKYVPVCHTLESEGFRPESRMFE